MIKNDILEKLFTALQTALEQYIHDKLTLDTWVSIKCSVIDELRKFAKAVDTTMDIIISEGTLDLQKCVLLIDLLDGQISVLVCLIKDKVRVNVIRNKY